MRKNNNSPHHPTY